VTNRTLTEILVQPRGPSQPTSYSYDVFGNLTTVTQSSQTRTFTYALNPETGTISYQYDDNGNLEVKTDARAASTHFACDSLNRVTHRWYNGLNSAASVMTHNDPALPSSVGTTNEPSSITTPNRCPQARHPIRLVPLLDAWSLTLTAAPVTAIISPMTCSVEQRSRSSRLAPRTIKLAPATTCQARSER